jgi:hypothetical protein
VTYLLTGSRAWTLALVRAAMTDLLVDLLSDREVTDARQALLVGITGRWQANEEAGASSTFLPDPGAPRAVETRRTRTQAALARCGEHQRAALALHVFGGLSLDALAALLDTSPELAYAQIELSRARLVREAGIEHAGDLIGALNAASLDVPRQALWPDIERDVRDRAAREARHRRLLNAGAIAAVLALLASGVLLLVVTGEGERSSTPATATARQIVNPELAQGIPYIILPTSTPTPVADVADTLLLSSRDAGAARTSLFDEREPATALLGEHAVEAAPPVIAPDGEHILMLWYAYEGGRARGYVAAFDGALTSELWRTEIAVDEQAEAGHPLAFRLSAAIDHERVYVARHPWQAGALIEIDVLQRASGRLEETIVTNLAGFAAHDIRLHAPPGANAVHLFAITGEAPPESGQLAITFLAYQVPGGHRLHGRILYDLVDSRVFFLYDSRLIAGTQRLFGVDHTSYYRQIAVHFFNLETGIVEPRLVLPFQPLTDPMPYQRAVSHDGRWLYVLSPASLEIAVVDLFERSLAGIVPLDPGVMAGQDIGVVYPATRQMQISPDGARLYVTGSLAGSTSGIWVIDIVSWTIVEHWHPDTRPVEILLSGDGRTLYFREEAASTPYTSQSSLTAVDTISGDAHAVAVPGAERFSLSSIVALYQRSYASTPWVAGQPAFSITSTSPLATPLVDIRPTEIDPAGTVTVEVRFVHPLTGEPVAESSDGARFQPPSGVRATWTPPGGGTPLILELGRIGYGHYEGFMSLPEDGHWRLRLDIDWPAGSLDDRTVLLGTAVEVRAAPAEPSALNGPLRG